MKNRSIESVIKTLLIISMLGIIARWYFIYLYVLIITDINSYQTFMTGLIGLIITLLILKSFQK